MGARIVVLRSPGRRLAWPKSFKDVRRMHVTKKYWLVMVALLLYIASIICYGLGYFLVGHILYDISFVMLAFYFYAFYWEWRRKGRVTYP